MARPHGFEVSFGPGAGPAEALGPGLLISLCVTWGRPVRYAVGALFALTGLAAPFAPLGTACVGAGDGGPGRGRRRSTGVHVRGTA